MLSKDEAGYEIAKPDQDHCDECKWFRKLACEWVEGRISPQGWCRLFHRGKVNISGLARKSEESRAYVRQMRGT